MSTSIPSGLHHTPTTIGHTWIWRGHAIHYVRSGTAQHRRPPLLLIHGFGASTDHWRKTRQGLQEEFDVWAIDLLGFGQSAKPDLTYSGELWRDQIHAFVTTVIGQPAVLAGNSLGGYVSLCVAAEHPHSTAGVVLLNSAGPFQTTQPSTPANPLHGWIQTLTRALLLQPLPSWLLFQYVRQRSMIAKTLKKVYVDHTAITDELIEAIRRPADDPGAARVFASVFKAPKGETVDTLLGRMHAPLLLIWGEGDPWMNVRQRSSQFRLHYSNLQEHFLQAGHCPHDEVPQHVNPLIRTWILETLQPSTPHS